MPSQAHPAQPAAAPYGQNGRARRWLLAAIVLFHGALFYALAHDMVRVPVLQATPREVFVSLIAAPPAPAHVAAAAPAVPRPVIEHYRKQVQAVEMPALPAPAVAPAHDSVLAAAPAAPVAAPSTPASAAPAVAVAAAPTVPRTVSTGISYLRAPQPQYPTMARKLGEQGTVMLRVFVNEQGRPERVDVCQSSGSSRLDEAARQAVLRALFRPYSEGGVAQAMFAMVPIRFSADA